jgi:hypothetical protein
MHLFNYIVLQVTEYKAKCEKSNTIIVPPKMFDLRNKYSNFNDLLSWTELYFYRDCSVRQTPGFAERSLA